LGDGGRADVVTVSGQCFAQPHDGVFNLMIRLWWVGASAH
jgi:hypothetical protein